ncbi:uronate isomerase [Klebsiella pneumoniae]|uniref:Uronate isomerase n=1 Tax=Klebsiella pneumoniae TaxID=573 RepID=A0A378FU54_KLEPN|nr:uronate isomerase [Klebsiella pneumoniae]
MTFWRAAWLAETLSEHEVAQFKTAVLVFLGAEYARRGWVQQYHIGALRNNNLRQFKTVRARRRLRLDQRSSDGEELSKLLSKQNRRKPAAENDSLLPEPA